MGVEQYKSLFVTESEEHLQIINNSVLALEKNPSDSKILNEIFRSAHTLKGMSATMGFEELTKLTHKMEDVLDVFRTQKIPVTPEAVDTLFKCLDMLQMLLEEIKTEKNFHLDVDAMILQLESTIPTIGAMQDIGLIGEKNEITITEMEKENLSAILSKQKASLYSIDVYLSSDCQLKSVRVFMVFNKLEELGEVIKTMPSVENLEMNRFGRMFSLLLLSREGKKKIKDTLSLILEVEKIDIKQIEAISELKMEGRAAASSPQHKAAPEKGKTGQDIMQQMGFKKIQSIRVSTERLDNLMNFVGELVISKIRLMQIAQTERVASLQEVLTHIDRLTTDLQDEVMQARLIPMAQVFDRFPRMVRDLARSEHKQINFEVLGGEIELDRTVLDEVADPLVHLLRNSVDHGIELPDERKSVKKSPVGTIKLSARRERTYVLIEVTDDGKGIDPQVIRKVALKKGFMGEEELNKMSDKELINIITLPGFSSAETITDTSGRGVGMDVVKMKIEALGGTLSFDSEVNKGSRFMLKLPLTVAIIRAMLVKVKDEIYATPIANIAETVKLNKNRIKKVEKLEVINLRNEVLPLIRLEKILGCEQSAIQTVDDEISIVIVESSGRKAGLVVDQVVGQQEVVIKQIGSLLKGIKGFAGATILGDGRVALILDVATLVG